MKPTLSIFSGLAVAVTLTFSSCGENKSSAEESADSNPSAAQSAKNYPLDICVVSGEELGSMGKPYVITHEGTEVHMCCKECLPKFKANPDKFVAMVKAGKAEN